jgi:FMN phosphatase YigB (HAD superfamily)
MLSMIEDVVYLVDVDNTLLDNDAVVRNFNRRLGEVVDGAAVTRYWQLFEELFAGGGYADYLGTLQRLRLERPLDMTLFQAAFFLRDYPFAEALYPGALETIAMLRRRGRVVILSDGDVVHQPSKIQRSGLWDAVDGHVLIYVHKEEMLHDVERRYPAARYVLVEDKLRILTAVKAIWKERVTAVFVRQGHYAHDPAVLAAYPPAEVAVDRIDEVPAAIA